MEEALIRKLTGVGGWGGGVGVWCEGVENHESEREREREREGRRERSAPIKAAAAAAPLKRTESRALA
jgi:hypothetical protein